jgi:hypothetical protein
MAAPDVKQLLALDLETRLALVERRSVDPSMWQVHWMWLTSLRSPEADVPWATRSSGGR